MKPSSTIAAVFAVAAISSVVSARSLSAQMPCSNTKAMADSAREEVMTVLTSNGTLAQEIRQEQHLDTPRTLRSEVVRDRQICMKLATEFGHPVGARTSFVVLHVGPLYYAREPDQQRGTGILTDSTFHVIARLGVSLPPDAGVKAPER